MSRLWQWTALMILLVLAGGCLGRSPERPPAGSPPTPRQATVTRELVLYFADTQAEKVTPERRQVQVKPEEPLVPVIVQELSNGPRVKGHFPTLPPGTRLLDWKLEQGLLTLNFSREIQVNHPGGTAGEAMTIYSLVTSLTELPEVKEVQFLVEGEKNEAIWGHADTTRPFQRNPAMIDKP